jgi:hypothetical protein
MPRRRVKWRCTRANDLGVAIWANGVESIVWNGMGWEGMGRDGKGWEGDGMMVSERSGAGQETNANRYIVMAPGVLGASQTLTVPEGTPPSITNLHKGIHTEVSGFI